MSDLTPAADRADWLSAVRGREWNEYAGYPGPDGSERAARRDVKELLAYIDTLREYLREKNEIIRAYAGPTGMTPEDVAYMREERKR